MTSYTPQKAFKKVAIHTVILMPFLLTSNFLAWATDRVINYSYYEDYQLKDADYGNGSRIEYAYDDAGNHDTVDTYTVSSTITSPPNNSFLNGTSIAITGTATASKGQTIQLVDVSTDGGATWNAASGASSWSYLWQPSGEGVEQWAG